MRPVLLDITLCQWVMEYRRFEATYRLYPERSRGLRAYKQSKRNAIRLLTAYPKMNDINSK